MPVISRALVVGGGIGGLTAGIALAKNGIEVDLVEIRPDLSVYGVGIIQPNNMLRALAQIGLADPCIEKGKGFLGWKIFDGQGAPIMAAPAANSAAPHYPPINGITRPDLHHILTDAARQHGVNIRVDDTLADYEEDDTSITVNFRSGRSRRYDLVIASDGAYSDMRKRIYGNKFVNTFTGQGVWRYNLPILPDMDWGVFYYGASTKMGLVPMNTETMYMLIVSAEPDNPRFAGDRMADFMRDRLSGYGGIVPELRKMITDPKQVVYRPMEPALVTDPWFRGRVVLIGDAVHATTPHLAQGAGMAIEDGVLLGELMARDGSLSDALQEFMRRRYPRGKYVVDTSVRVGQLEMVEWSGKVPEPMPAALLHEASLKLLEAY